MVALYCQRFCYTLLNFVTLIFCNLFTYNRLIKNTVTRVTPDSYRDVTHTRVTNALAAPRIIRFSNTLHTTANTAARHYPTKT
jgi:hypothetical protein